MTGVAMSVHADRRCMHIAKLMHEFMNTHRLIHSLLSWISVFIYSFSDKPCMCMHATSTMWSEPGQYDDYKIQN